MTKTATIEQLRQYFRGREFFSREELYVFYKQFDPDLKENTFRWRIYSLKKNKVISSVSRELFTLSYKPTFKPQIEKDERELFAITKKQFPTLRFCIWTTQIVSEFMLHIPAKSLTILQMEKEALEPVYDFLKEKKYWTVFIQPKENEIDRYVYESENAVILLPLVSKSSIQKINKTVTTTLEKLIVDLYSDKKLFAPFQGSEFIHIVNNAYNRYAIDFTRLFHYAKRRRKDIDLKKSFIDKTDIPKNILND